MRFYKMEVEYNRARNIDWFYGSLDGDADLFGVLSTSHRLSAIWSPPTVEIFMEKYRPNIYRIDDDFALDAFACDCLSSFLARDAELLPLKCMDGTAILLLHPLYTAVLKEDAEYRRGANNGNLIEIYRYSFSAPTSYYGEPCHLFRIRNFPDSPSGALGSAFGALIVSSDFRDAVLEHRISGVAFTLVFDTGE